MTHARWKITPRRRADFQGRNTPAGDRCGLNLRAAYCVLRGDVGARCHKPRATLVVNERIRDELLTDSRVRTDTLALTSDTLALSFTRDGQQPHFPGGSRQGPGHADTLHGGESAALAPAQKASTSRHVMDGGRRAGGWAAFPLGREPLLR